MRIGVVSFVNSKPYALGLAAVRRQGAAFEIVSRPPRELSEMLEAGALDIALIPAFDHLRGIGTGFVPGHGIASAGVVDTVRLFYRQTEDSNGATSLPPLDVIYADQRSASSVALLRVLLADYFKQTVPIERCDIFEQPAPGEREGLLVIGDAAHGIRPGLASVDLGGVWTEWTGLPFVYALWVGTDAALIAEAQPILDAALDWADGHVEEIIAHSSAESGFSREWIRDYLYRLLIHRIGERELAGLAEFRRRAFPGLCSGAAVSESQEWRAS